MSDIDLTEEVEAAHAFTSSSRSRGRGITENVAACTCGHQLDWYSRNDAHRKHVLAELAQAVREQAARDILSGLPAALITTARDEDGWASDMQDAQLRLVDDEWVAFCGEGAVDIQHIAEHAARIARGDS